MQETWVRFLGWEAPGEGTGNPLQYSCLENPHGQRSLVGCSPWGCKELAIGAASHVVGTSKCIEMQKEKQVVMASVALVIVGILTATIAPLLLFLLTH